MGYTDTVSAFLDSLAQHGIQIDPARVQADGAWHALHVEGDRAGTKKLSYRFYPDGEGGFWQDHKRGLSATFWRASRPDETPEQRQARKIEQQRIIEARRAQDAADYARAAAEAEEFMSRADRDPREHAYVRRKNATPGPSIRYNAGGLLLIPVYQAPGRLAGYQWITPDGYKENQEGAQFSGSWHPIQGPDKSAIVICEGWATGAALAAALGYSVACAMSSGNIKAVSDKIRALYPGRPLILAADNDAETERKHFERTGVSGKNPGVNACRAVAEPGEIVMIPVFNPGDPGTDWDDAIRLYGPGFAREVLAALRAAQNGQESTQTPGPPPSPAFVPEPLPVAVLPRIRTDLTAHVEDMAIPAKYSELSVSGELARQCAESLRYVHAWGRWMTWTGQRWQPDQTLFAVEYSKRMCAAVSETARADYATFTTETQRAAVIQKYGSSSAIGSVLELARSDRRIAATVHQWDADLWALNTPAGVVDLRTGELRGPVIDDYCTKITACAPASSADCPRWLEFMATATGGDFELIRFLQKIAGYALTGEVSEHVLVFLYGPGGNGKGTFLNTLLHVLGDYAMAASTDLVTERKHEAHPTELADLQGARLVIAQETEEGKRWAEARIKSLTGGDKIRARFMRQNFFEFQPQLTLVMSGNHRPGLRNVDEAIRRRLRLVPFDAKIAPEKRDPSLPEKLRAEAPAILRWCIDGCLAWQREGLRAPDRVLAATDDYLESQDSFGAWIDEACDTGEAYSMARSELYGSFRRWCSASGEFAVPLKRFIATLEQRGFTPADSRARTVIIRGIRARPVEYPQQQEMGRAGW